jgi:sugar/nucleoside kinase (ribokinase family)
MDDAVPDYVVLGHVTLDKVPEGYVLGGTAVYGAITARNLGLSVGILTSGSPKQAEALRMRGIDIRSLPSQHTTIFENIYHPEGRIQYIRAVAGHIGPNDVPVGWRTAPIVHLGPLARELDAALVGCFGDALIGVTPQGWLRAWDASGRVRYRPWSEAQSVLSRVTVLVFSEADVQGDRAAMRELVQMSSVAVVTLGDQGCDLYVEGERRHFPAYATREVDPTGAGDVFAAAFLIRLHESYDPTEAANFANCVASFAVEAVGTSGIPTREQVLSRYHAL